MVVLQPFSLGAGVLLLSFLLLQEVLLGARQHRPALHLRDAVWGLLPHGTSMLAPCVLAFLSLSTVAAPLWFWLAAVMRPASYVRMAAALVSASCCVAFVALQCMQVLAVAVAVTGVTNLVCCPLLGHGLLGQEDVDVFEVGRGMLALSELTRYGLLAACMALAAAAAGPLPHQLLAGLMLLASGAMALWLWGPGALGPAYRHLGLTFRGAWRLLPHLSCFWLSLLAGACDSLALVLTGFLVVATTASLATLAAFWAVTFAGCAAAVAWNWAALRSRAAELHLNGAVLALAAMPLLQAAKAGVLVAGLRTGVMLALCGVLDVLLGGRASVMGLAGFVTLPSREIVMIWQLGGIMLGSVASVLVLGGAYAGVQAGAAPSAWLLFGAVAGLEGLRGGAMALLARAYSSENLSAP